MITSNATAVGIDVKEYGLPSDIEECKKATKTETSKKDNRFKRLFRALSVASATDFEKLEIWIRHLKDGNCNAGMRKLRNCN